MSLLTKVLVDKIGEYLPGLDKEQLRLDVLNGRCFVENADCTPSPAVVLGELPIRLVSGHIGSLELNVPWNTLSSSPVRLRVSNVTFRFEEIGFPSRLEDVREAFRAARTRNNTQNGGNSESFALRWLRKLLPLFLDRFEMDYADISFGFTLADGHQLSLRCELDLKDISIGLSLTDGYHVTLNLAEVCTIDVPTGDDSLAKKLRFSDTTAHVYKKVHRNSSNHDFDSVTTVTAVDFGEGLWFKKQLLRIRSFDTSLRMENGTVSLVFDIPGTLNVKLDSLIVEVLMSLKKNRSKWMRELVGETDHAYILQKPSDEPSKNLFQVLVDVKSLALELTCAGSRALLRAERSHYRFTIDELPRVFADIKSVSLELTRRESRALLRAERGRYRFADGLHSGSVQTIELLDLSCRSADYCCAIRSMSPEMEPSSVSNSLSFRMRLSSINIDLHGLQVIVLRSFLDELFFLMQGIAPVVNRFLLILENDANANLPALSISVTGKQLQVIFPIHKSSPGGVRVDIRCAEYNAVGDSHLLRIKDSSLFTGSCQPLRRQGSSGNLEWVKVLRKLDFDLRFEQNSFYQDSINSFETSDAPNKVKTQWSVNILTHVYLYLVPSQVSTIHFSIMQLLLPQSSVSSVATKAESNLIAVSHDDSSSDDEIRGQANYCEHLVVDVATDLITVELISEDELGGIASVIASISCGPCHYMFDSIHELGNDSDTTVVHQRLYTRSICIEDRRDGTSREKALFLVVPKKEYPIDTTMEKSPVRYECLTRLERGVEKTSAKISIHDPLVYFSSDLLASLINFTTNATSTDRFEGSTASSDSTENDMDNRITSNLSNRNVPEQTVSAATIDPEIMAKYSISIVRPTIYVPYVSKDREEFGLKLESPGMKTILLYGKNGQLLADSLIKSKDLTLSMQPQCEGGADSFLLRARGGLELRFGRELEYLTGNARFSADVFSMGGSNSVRDQLFAPCDILVKVHISSLRISITMPRSIQLTISPLTVRTVTSIAVLIQDHLDHLELLRRTSSFDRAVQQAQAGRDSRPEFLVNVRAIVMLLVAEKPRAHLMRLVFREIKCYLKLPVEGLSWGCFDFDVGDVILEDVFSQILSGVGEEDSAVQWRTVFSSAHDLTSSHHRRGRFLEIMPPTMPVAERNRMSAKALIQSFRELKFSERQKALLPCSMADSAQEELPSLDDDSFLSMRAKWQHLIENLTLHLVLKPLDLHLNSIILPSLLAWGDTVSDAVSSVLGKRGAVPVAPKAYFHSQEYNTESPITLARLVIEPIVIRLATKAPPPPLESSALRRLIDWLVGTDCMSGLTLESGRVSFAGVFQNAGSLFRRVRDEYRRSLLSRSVARQLLLQITTVSNLARVGAATFLRSNRTCVIQPLPDTSETPKQQAHIVSGLAELLDELEEQTDRRRLGFGNRLQITSGIITRLQPSSSRLGAPACEELEVLNLVP